jgi:1-acyl-sn-glycerol-3-phosphate acyltransferase
MLDTMENFDDIRPFQDAEVAGIIERLLCNKEFIATMAEFQIPHLKKRFPKLSDRWLTARMKRKLEGIKSIAEVQEIVSLYFYKIVKNSTTSFHTSGLKKLPESYPHLFVSNHRDIVMDPALVGNLLRHSVHGTVQIAIGDNLLKKDYVSDLMRLNKSFIVKRSVQGREKLKASLHLSKYIGHAVRTGNNVWIAQREGRAKDGLDKTDPAILKMLHMANRELKPPTTLRETVQQLRIVPVSISYEYDPCAELKAQELYELDKNGSFNKSENSDIISISKGMNGQKGSVHVAFGEVVLAMDDDPVNIAKEIDQQIVNNYKLHPSNYLAYEELQTADSSIGPALKDMNVNLAELGVKRQEFHRIYQEVREELQPYILRMYANPVINKLSMEGYVKG